MKKLVVLLSLLSGMAIDAAHAGNYSITINPVCTTQITEWDGTTWDNGSSFPGNNVTYGVVQHGTYCSAILGTDVGYTVYLPPGYSSSNSYPMLYLIGGSGSNENSMMFMMPQLDSMIHASTVSPMIVVMPNPAEGDSHGMDAQSGAPAYPHYRYQSSIITELLPFIKSHYAVSAAKPALSGFSMGGQVCELWGFKYPSLWSSLYCMSPAIDDNGSNIASNEPTFSYEMLNNNYSLFDSIDVWYYVVANAASIAMPIHIVVGSSDALYNTTGCSPPGSPTGKCEPDMDTAMTNAGITHDALQVISGCGHDLPCILSGITAGANFSFSASHF